MIKGAEIKDSSYNEEIAIGKHQLNSVFFRAEQKRETEEEDRIETGKSFQTVGA